jgi:uncharacterized iron-regulated protein
MNKFVLSILSVSSACILLLGCPKRPALPPWASTIVSLTPTIGTEEIYRIPEGEKVSFDQLMTDVDTAKLVFIGEAHDQIEHHQIQSRILRELSTKGKDIVLGMEMFQRRQQPILDRWTQGHLTEKEFRKQVEWDTTWGVDYQLYKPILEEAKNQHLKILALNVDRDLVSKVAQVGMAGLSPEDRSKLPEMDLSNKDHRAYIRRIYRNHHGGQAKGFERFYESQVLWDEGMAETLSGFLRSAESRDKTVLVLAGGGHIVFDFGIPNRFYRRTPSPFKTIVLKEWSKEADQDFISSSASSPLADFLWLTAPNPPEQHRPRLGIFLKEKEGAEGLWIERVVPGSPAEEAGLLPGDQIIAVEGKVISEVSEIHHALSEKGWGSDITMTVIRDGEKKEIKVTLPPLKEQ